MTPRRVAAAAALIAAAAVVVGLAWVLLGPTSIDDAAPLASYQRTDDPRQILINAYLRPGESVASTDAQEDADRVSVTVRVNIPDGFVSNVGIRYPVLITLREALGDREVVDHLGRAVAEEVPHP